MRRTTLVAGALLLTAPMLTLSIPGRGVAAPRVKKPTFGAARLSPTRISGNGGPLQVVYVKINANGSTINSVTATTSVSKTPVTLTSSASGYTGSLQIPANPDTKKTRRVSVVVRVDSNSGVVTKTIGSVTQEKGTGNRDDSPPPPPPI